MSEVNTILRESPHDQKPMALEALDIVGAPEKRWLSSRYNIRAKTEDGSLLLWNTLSGAMNLFKPDQVSTVKPLLTRKGFQGPEEGVVGYLAKRGYLVAEGTDEYRRVQMAFGQQHYRTDSLELIMLASEDCNFRCKYCYEKFLRGTMRPEVREGIKNLVKKRLPALTRLSTEWFGGEPLYGMRAIEDLAPFFYQTALDNDLQYFSSMTTNGYLLTPDVVEKLFNWRVNHFQITVDGPPENHNCNRPTREGGPTFETIMKNLRSMSQREDDFHVTIRVNYDQHNHPKMSQFLEELNKDFAHDERYMVSFHAVGQWGGDNDEALDVCGVEESKRALRVMRKEAVKRGLNVATLRNISRVGGAVCYAARPYNYLIGADGKVMKCTIVLDTQENNVVGRLGRDGEIAMNDDHFALWTEPAFEQDSQCQKCAVLPLCQGIHCPLIRINHDTQPCISLRKEGKHALVETFELQGNKARTSQLLGNVRSSPMLV